MIGVSYDFQDAKDFHSMSVKLFTETPCYSKIGD